MVTFVSGKTNPESCFTVNTSLSFLIEEAGMCQQQKFSGLNYNSGHENGINFA